MNYSVVRFFLGWVLLIESAFMAIPAVTGFIYGERSGLIYLIVGLATSLVGYLLIRLKTVNKQFFAKEGFTAVGLSWIAMSVVGAIPLCVSGDIPSYIDALFEVVSGFTTTGATILTNVETVSHAGNMWRCLSHFIGGMGVFVFLITILPLVGGFNMHLLRAESPGPTVGKLVPKAKESAKILYIIYISMTVIMFILLLCGRMPVFDALCTSFGTAGTGGFGIKADSLASYSPYIQWVVTVFMALFGVNFNIYFFIIFRQFKNAFNIEEVRWYAGLILISAAVISFNILGNYDAYGDSIRDAAFQVCSIISSTGFATVDFNLWPSLSKTILIILMFTGACAGSTGGGIKVSRLLIAFKTIRQEMNQFIHPRSVKSVDMDGKAVDKNTVRSVAVYFTLFVFIYFGSILLISFNGFDMVTNCTAVLATMNNIGPGLEMVGPTGGFGDFSIFSKLVFIFDMLAGRLEFYPILLLFAPGLWKKH